MSFGKIGSLEKKRSMTHHHLSGAAHLPNKSIMEREGLALSPSFLTAASSKDPEGLTAGSAL